MTKFRWDKAGELQPDPGAVVTPPEEIRPDSWTPPQEKARRRAEREKETEELRQRSDRARFTAVVQKFGNERAAQLGVPREFIRSLEEAKKQAAPSQARRKKMALLEAVRFKRPSPKR